MTPISKIITASVIDQSMAMEEHWNDNDRGNLKVREAKPVPVKLTPPQISEGMVWD
jgi:hypothetical protein